MIEELLHVARLQNQTGCEPFANRKIHWLVELNERGNVIGITSTVGEPIDKADNKKDVELKYSRGKEFKNVPCNYFMQLRSIEKKSGKKVKHYEDINPVDRNDSTWLPLPFVVVLSDLLCSLYSTSEIQAKRKKDDQNLRTANRLAQRSSSFLQLMGEATLSDNLQSENFKSVQKYLQSPDGEEVLTNYLLKSLNCEDSLSPNKTELSDKQIHALIGVAKESVAFRVNGKLVFRDVSFREWWDEKFKKQKADVITESPSGTDSYPTDDEEAKNGTKLTTYFPQINGKISFASFNRAPFESFGLGSHTTYMRIEMAEQVAAALRWLLDKKNNCYQSIGGLEAVFWIKTADAVRPVNFISLLAEADTLQVKQFLNSVHKGKLSVISDDAKFNFAILKLNEGRFAVRSWHTENLREAEDRVRRYFEAIKLPPSKLSDEDATRLSLTELAKATVRENPTSDTYVMLFEAALFGGQTAMKLHKLFALVLERQKIEMTVGVAAAKGKNPYQRAQTFEERLNARTALIQLYFTLNGKNLFTEADQPMSIERHKKSNDALASDAAYLCGRLLAMLDRIHIRAHNQSGGTNTSPANRAYRAASTTPAFIFPQLLQTARYHLNKMENKGEAKNLQSGKFNERKQETVYEGLNGICARLQEVAPAQGFPRLFNLDEQGRFALGFYYERHVLDNSGDREADKTPSAPQPEATVQHEGANQ